MSRTGSPEPPTDDGSSALASPTIPGARVKRAAQREAWAVEGEAWLLEWEARLTVESRGRATASLW